MRQTNWFKKSTFLTGLLFLMGFMAFLLGCPGIQIQGDSQELVAKMSARHVGQKLAVENPGVALMLAPLAEMVLSSPTAHGVDLVEQLKTIAIDKIRDPLFKADIRDVVSMIKVDGPTLAVSQVRLIRAIAHGLLEGIRMEGRT